METLICMLVCVRLCDRVALKKHCNELMMMKFGRLVDLEALQTLSGNRRVEELKQEKCLREAAHAKEIKEWNVRSHVCVCVCTLATVGYLYFCLN